jgi:hypothetical protein
MKKWGVIVSLFFAAVVLALLVPATFLFAKASPSLSDFRDVYGAWVTWICAGSILAGQFLLLWLKVDTTRKRLKPRTHVLVSAITTGLFLSILTLSIILAIGLAVGGDKFLDLIPDAAPLTTILVAYAVPWLVWGILFYRFSRDSEDAITRAVRWLLRGSVLELLIAVPAHVIVRRRNDCSAPVVTGFGITAGIAIMLISFGPSVLLLYRKRMERYSRSSEGK